MDYVNNTLTLDQPLSWTDGQGVSLAYNGKAPDIGAYEYTPTQAVEYPKVLVTLNTPKFIALGGTDSQGRDSMASSLANDLTYEILTAPQHGTLSGNLVGVKTAVLTYVPTKDYQGPDSFTYRAKDGAWTSQVYTVRLNVAPWKLPIGIPDPGFGIQESHWMYENAAFDYTQAGTINDPRGMTARYEDAGNGPYTHYVDASNPLATDGGNPYGTPALPRRTIPPNLPAGSVVEVHSTVADGRLEIGISGIGTAAMPIFVRGPDMVNRTPMNGSVRVGYRASAAHIIVENIEALRGVGISGREAGTDFTTSYITLRNSESHNAPYSSGVGASTYTENQIHHIVLYNNIVHDNGVWDPLVAVGDEDHHGFSVGVISYVWVLDNEMYHNSGDGIQINNGDTDGHDFYVGRNVAHHNKQTGFWCKQATNVIFSQNTAYWHRVSSSNMGAGMGFQLSPHNIWFLFNHIYDCNFGFRSGDSTSDPAEIAYLIGNMVHDIHVDEIYNKGTWSSQAMSFGGGVEIHVLDNTIYDTDDGIGAGGMSRSIEIANNIVSNVTVAAKDEISLNTALSAAGLRNNIFYRGGDPIRINYLGRVYDLAGFQAAFPGVADGSIKTDPKFVDPANNDFHLQADSPAIDKGIETSVFQTFYNLYGIDIQKDFDANLRPQGAGWDIGAYEYTPQGAGIYGDVNSDSVVNALDVQACVNHILGTQDWAGKADVNKDSAINALDIQAIVNIILGV
jgi:hypothetical protein